MNQLIKKILLLSDSHGRNCASLLNDLLKPKYCTTSVIKPNACLDSVIEGASEIASDFKHEDVVIILGGTNDIRKKNNFIPGLEKSIAALDHTNILLCTIPYCYDNPKINSSVYKSNEHIMKLSTKFANVKVIDVNAFLQRNDYTYHGLHLNKTGKSNLCRSIATAIKNPWKQREIIKTLTFCSVRKVTLFGTGATPCQTTQATNINARNRCTSLSSKQNSAREATPCQVIQESNVKARNLSVSQPITFKSQSNSVLSGCVMEPSSIVSSSNVISSQSHSSQISTSQEEASSKGTQQFESNSDAACSRKNAILRSSTRARRVPNRSGDFLWPALTRPQQRQRVNKVPTLL